MPAASFAKEGSTAVLKSAVGTGLSDTNGKGVFGILAQAAVAAAGKEKKRDKRKVTAPQPDKEKTKAAFTAFFSPGAVKGGMEEGAEKEGRAGKRVRGKVKSVKEDAIVAESVQAGNGGAEAKESKRKKKVEDRKQGGASEAGVDNEDEHFQPAGRGKRRGEEAGSAGGAFASCANQKPREAVKGKGRYGRKKVAIQDDDVTFLGEEGPPG